MSSVERQQQQRRSWRMTVIQQMAINSGIGQQQPQKQQQHCVEHHVGHRTASQQHYIIEGTQLLLLLL